jgi:hypothetical protein
MYCAKCGKKLSKGKEGVACLHLVVSIEPGTSKDDISLVKQSLGHYAAYIVDGKLEFNFCHECLLDIIFAGNKPLMVVPHV